jgi:hypothetical protein
MKIKIAIVIFISILAVLGGGILNFREFINNYWPVGIKNVIVTATYIVTWIIVLSITIRYKYFRIAKVYSMFWLITLIYAILLILCNTTRFNLGLVMLPAIPFLCPWYWLKYYIKDNMNIGILIAICSFSILVINNFFIILRKKTNKNN